MASIISDRMVKAFDKFNADLMAFGDVTGEVFIALYEDANTPRYVANFKLQKNGKLKWVEQEMKYDSKAGGWNYVSVDECEQLMDDDEAREYLSFWRANLRRAKRYLAMEVEKLDAIQNGEAEDTDDED